MNRSQNQILQEIDNFYPTSDENWLGLESLLAELWETNISQACLKTLFHVFEKFPEDEEQAFFGVLFTGLNQRTSNTIVRCGSRLSASHPSSVR